jgi:hypothetical protein
LYPVDYFEKLDIANGDGRGNAAKTTDGELDDSANGRHEEVKQAVASSSKLKRKMDNKKKPTALKSVKAKKGKP